MTITEIRQPEEGCYSLLFLLSKDDIAGCKAPQGIIKWNLRTLSESTNLPSSTQLCFQELFLLQIKILGQWRYMELEQSIDPVVFSVTPSYPSFTRLIHAPQPSTHFQSGSLNKITSSDASICFKE